MKHKKYGRSGAFTWLAAQCKQFLPSLSVDEGSKPLSISNLATPVCPE